MINENQKPRIRHFAYAAAYMIVHPDRVLEFWKISGYL
jgi:hypothetical protein